MAQDFYRIGDHNVQCGICGKKRKRSQCRMQWDNVLACLVTNCWSPKHPNEYPRPTINDGLPVSNARPRPDADHLTFLAWPPITTWEQTGLTWETADWRWDDDLSNGTLFQDGNP